MTKVFLISGLGADRRFFKHVELPEGFEKVLADVVTPERQESIADYASKVISHNGISEGDIVLGDSLGGLIAVEIAKQKKLTKVILTSSIKTHSEAPWYFKIARRLPVYQLTPVKLMKRLSVLAKLVMHGMPAEDLSTLQDMLKHSSPEFLKWGSHAALDWRNEIVPDNLYHLMGEKDIIFPCKNIKDPTVVIKGGTHIMVFNRAGEINKILAEILQS